MSEPDPAKVRWAVIQAVRAGGVAMTLAGLAIAVPGSRVPAWVPDPVGWALIAFGLVDVLVVPTVLARRWRSPPP